MISSKKFFLIAAMALLPFYAAPLMALPSSSVQRHTSIDLNLNNIELKEFIKLVSKVLKKNILIPFPISGKVNFVASAPIYKEDLYPILLQVLETKGYTLVSNGTYLELVRATDASRKNTPISNGQESGKTKGMVIAKIEIKHTSASEIMSKIRIMVSKFAKIQVLKSSNALLLTDFPENIARIKKVIAMIEEKKDIHMEIVNVKNVDLSVVDMQIKQIAGSIFNKSIPGQTVKIIKDAKHNAFILIGKKENVQKTVKIIHRLDRPENIVEEMTKIVPLANSDAKQVQATLMNIISKKRYTDPSMKPNIAMSEEINAIILMGPEESIKPLEKIIKTMDREKYQVYVQVKILELSETKAKEVGMKYGIGGGTTSSNLLFTFAGNMGASPVIVPSGLQIDQIVDTKNLSSNLALGAAISLLASEGASQTVSQPVVLCINNKESSVYVGKTKSFLTGQTTNANGATATYKREDIGLTLKVKPRVANREKVTLIVESRLENVDSSDTAQNAYSPTTTKQEVKTEVIVRSGESIIIGGLIQNTASDRIQKIPFFGDIPVIGKAFQNKQKSSDRKNILIVLTPYIIEKSSSLMQLQHFLSEFDKIQTEYNKEMFKRIKMRLKKEQNKSAKKSKSYKKNHKLLRQHDEILGWVDS